MWDVGFGMWMRKKMGAEKVAIKYQTVLILLVDFKCFKSCPNYE